MSEDAKEFWLAALFIYIFYIWTGTLFPLIILLYNLPYPVLFSTEDSDS